MEATPILVEPSEEELAEIHRRFDVLRQSSDWLDAHYEDLVVQYADAWVAYAPEGFVSADASIEKLLDSIDATRLERGEIQIEFIPKSPARINPAHITIPS